MRHVQRHILVYKIYYTYVYIEYAVRTLWLQVTEACLWLLQWCYTQAAWNKKLVQFSQETTIRWNKRSLWIWLCAVNTHKAFVKHTLYTPSLIVSYSSLYEYRWARRPVLPLKQANIYLQIECHIFTHNLAFKQS